MNTVNIEKRDKTSRIGDTGGHFERHDSVDSFEKEVEKVEKSFNTNKSMVRREEGGDESSLASIKN